MKKLIVALIIINCLLSGWLFYQNNLYFHTDIARDFLLIEEVVTTKHPTLIGPRSGGIPGVFHGPLWLYLNLPAFFLGGGNPVFVGYFWLCLSILGVGITYWVGKKLYNENVGLVSALMLSSFSITFVANMFNPYGAVMLSPLFMYLFYTYLQTFRVQYLVSSLFVLGVIIQFQMAFGVPILVLCVPYLAVLLWRKGLMKHFLSFAALLLPLSSFLVFELRNNFLQVVSVWNYVSGQEDHGKVTLVEKISTRLQGAFVDGVGLFPSEVRVLSLLAVLFIGYKLYRQHQKDPAFWRSYAGLFTYFYGGFWIMACLFSGVIWGYYYWPFLPLTLILISSLAFEKKIAHKGIAAIIVLILIFQTAVGIRFIRHSQTFIHDAGSWSFNSQAAQDMFEDAPAEFGYFIFTPDQYGYTPRYAINYQQRKFADKQAVPFQKRSVTYLLIAPAPKKRPDLNGDWWKLHQVKVDRKPDHVFRYSNGFIVEKYMLSAEEVAIQAEPNLIQDLTFR